MTSRFATHVALASLMLAACGSKKSDQAQSIISEDLGSGAELKTDEPPKLPPMTPKKLAPVIHELGAERVVPTSIVIELAAPIVDRDSVGSSSAKSVLKIKPEIAGTLTHSGPSQLTFTPNAPFEFDTTYEVDLQKVETRDGVIEAGGEKWTHSFKTPKFQFLGWAPNDVDLAHHKVTMQIEFSGAVLPNVARERSTISINGTPTNNVQVLPNRQPDKLLVLISDPQLVPGAKLSLAIKRDLPALANAKLNGATAEYTVKADKPVSIKTAQLVEGTTGYYLEVICNDAAATPGNRAFYENEGYYNLSQRCQLTEEALASRIHFTPAVKRAYITSGRAGFRVFGDFKRGVYSVKIDAGSQSVDGGTVLAPFARSFAVTARKPLLGFAASGRYLPRKAWANLGIKHTNMEAVNLIVRQVPPENLVFWLGNTGSDVADERTSNVVLRKTIPLRGDLDVASTTWLDVEQLLPTTSKGVLELKLVGVGATATSRLLLTNLSIVAKKTSPAGKPWLQTVQVWALDMESADALTGVEVSLVRKSGKVVAKCATAGKDGCTLDAKSDSDPDQAEPFALIAKKGDDLTYLRYQDLRADVAESATAGTPYVATTPYRASVYSDRGVYRPGDTAHVVAIVRDAKDRAPDQALPIDVKVIDPRAKVVKKLTLKTNTAGQITFDHALPAFADTGHWRVQLAVADKALAGYDLQVEEFVPERMKVTATAKTPEASVGSAVAFDISAQYLFGGSAIDSGVTLTCSVEPERFSPEANSDLTYGVEPKGKPVSLGESRDQLDPRGMATVACPAPEATTQFTQTAKVEATVAVLEAGSGRATVRSASAMLHPEKFYIGAKTKATQAVSGQTFTVEGLIVDWTGKPAAAGVQKLDAELIHLEADYGYGYDEESGESSYQRSLRTVPEGKQEVVVRDGKFKLDVTPAEAGAGYMVRLRAGKATTELVLDGSYGYDYYYEYGDSGRVDQTPRPAKPTQLSLKTPKEIKVGESATVKVLTPYRGKILWTVETDKVIKAEWKDTSGGETSWDFKLPGFAPNVYVSAFLVKDPHLESKDAFMPDRAFGVSSVRVTPVEFTQTVKLDTPKEVRSSSPLTVKLDLGAAAADTFATVAVVDEGILSLTNFQTPDPLAQLFSRRSLGVETFETIGWTMLHQPAGNSSKTGGGDEGGAEGEGGRDSGRVQPVKPVAMFSGIVKVGPDGKLSVPFTIPQYRGKVRVMAITAGPTKVGRAEAEVLVRDPLVVQVTFPRFVTQNDEMQIPVFMTNVSGGPLDVSIAMTGETLAIPGLTLKGPAVPPLVFDGKDRGSVRIEDGRAETLVFATKANIPIGGAKLRVVAKAKGKAGAFEVVDEVEVPFLPAGPKERVIQKFKVDAGTIDLATKATVLKNWVPTSEHTTFWLTSNPYGESFDHLKYLIHYPYGCIEQTTSAARPLLYVGTLAEQVDPRLAELQIEDMVLSGINRIFSMQTPSGGFGYWPGATDPQEWGTAYATHFLLDAKKAGYSVPDDRLAEVMTWIEQRVQQRERGVFQRAAFRYYDEQAEAYLHYVLALNGKGKKARILSLISQFPANAKGEQAEDVYMLKAALYLAGDRRFERDLKKVDTSPISAERVNSWSFYSDQRRRGLMLSTFFDLFKLDPAGELLAQRVAEGLTGHHSYYYNTQELVWGVTGLGKWVTAQQAHGVAAGTLVADGATIGPRKTKKASNDKTWTVARASEAKQLTLEIPTSAAGMWLVVSSEGVRPGNAYKTGGNGMTVSRTYRSLEGTEIDPAAGDLKLGDLVFVEIELANTSGAYIQNIALVDRLPGGFEVENPRLGRTTKVDWVKDDDLWGMDFMNMRDDRLEAFGALPPKTTKKVVYTVRAVTSGKFTIPPVEAEAMYDPTLWARAPAGTAVVGGPWTGKTL